jgi:hypothetical protein
MEDSSSSHLRDDIWDFQKNWGASWELLYGYGRWTKYEVEPTKAHLNVYFFIFPPAYLMILR